VQAQGCGFIVWTRNRAPAEASAERANGTELAFLRPAKTAVPGLRYTILSCVPIEQLLVRAEATCARAYAKDG